MRRQAITTTTTASRRTLLVAVLAAVCLVAAGPAHAATQEQPKDIDITFAVKMELLNDSAVPSHLIDIATDQGVVTLSGSVDNALAKDRAAALAEMIKGVRAVVNDIQVKPVARSDAEIETDVKEALVEDPAADSYEVKVGVANGHVTLTGKVESWAEKTLAGQVAKGVRGVRGVSNAISVRYEGDRSDFQIAQDIEGRLAADAWIDDGLINVSVNDGKVDLDGTVGSAAERTRAQRTAWVAGAKAVDIGGLEIKWWARDAMRRKNKFKLKTDEQITKAVKDALLYDPRVFSFKPDVQVSDGVVTLSGEVDNLSAKLAAGQDARNTVGVVRVRNLLSVRPERVISDQDIKAKVDKAIQRDPYLSRSEITTAVYNGKVYLYGSVDSYFEKYHAKPVVATLHGVVDVANRLTVATEWAQKSDWEIKESIEDQLWWSPFVEHEEVTVSVEDGVATLRGTVDSEMERGAAVDNAFDGGADSVRDRLKVRRAEETEDDENRFGYFPHTYPNPYTPYSF